MGLNKFKAVDGTEYSFDESVTVVDCSQSGTIAQINISYTPKDKDIVVIHFANDVDTNETSWVVRMGMVSYYILKQDGSNFADDISAGTYLMLVVNSSDYAFYLLGGSDVPVATASTLGIVRPDGTTMTIADGVLTVQGSGGDAYPLSQAQVEALLALI